MADVQKLNVNNTTYDISTTWSKVTGKPSTFTPSSHTHTKSQITDFPSSMPASDVYSWAKAASKPSYTAAEVGLGNIANYGLYDSTNYNTSVGYAVINGGVMEVGNRIDFHSVTGSNDYEVSLRINRGENTKRKIYFPASEGTLAIHGDPQPASDVYSWAKAASKPTYTYSEVGAAASGHTHTSFANSITVTGSVSASSGFYQSSDERLKTFHDPIKVDLEKLKKLRKNYFKFNDNDELQIGVSAQEIQSIYPEIVTENDEGYLSVAYDKLSVIALAALDEQQKEIDDLKDQLSTIKNILKEKGIL